MKNLKYLFFFNLIFFFSVSLAENHFPSYQSSYDINLVKSKVNPQIGKTYVSKAEGELFVDWLNNCDSWVSNQRMVTKFINSHGVGTLNEINYSLVEKNNGNHLKFSLEVKENAELVERTFGTASIGETVTVKFDMSDKEPINLPDNVIFPRTFLKDVLKNINGDQQILTRRVYEGTIPDKFFDISIFFTDEKIKENLDFLPDNVKNNFSKIRMAYYQDQTPTPILEMTQHINQQGIASYFRFDYPEYSLEMKLKKIDIVKIPCD